MKCKEIKTYDFVKAYFSNVDILIHAIYEYRRVSNVRNGEWTISDLLNRKGGKQKMSVLEDKFNLEEKQKLENMYLGDKKRDG